MRARTVHRHSNGTARSGSTNDEFSTTPPGCRRRNLPTRMTGCASPPEKQCRVVATIRHAVRLRIPTRVSQLAGRRRALRGALDEGKIVDQPHQDAGQPQRLTAAQTDPLHWLLAVDRPRLHHHACRCRRCGLARFTEQTCAPGGRTRDAPISRSYLTEAGFRQAPQAAQSFPFRGSRWRRYLPRFPGGYGALPSRARFTPAGRHIDTRRSTSPAVTARRPPGGKSAQVHRDAPLPRNQDQSGHKVGPDFGATSRRANLRS